MGKINTVAEDSDRTMYTLEEDYATSALINVLPGLISHKPGSFPSQHWQSAFQPGIQVDIFVGNHLGSVNSERSLYRIACLFQ